MKKIISLLGVTTMICMSIIISEKTTTVVKDIDNMLTELKEKSNQYKTPPINAIIENNTIIPGLNGEEIDINKTYKELKKIGLTNEKYFIYKQIYPEQTIKNQYDKYIISGNPKKNTISIIFKVYETDNIENVSNILKKNNIKVNFYVDNYWQEKNKEKITELIKQGHIIETINNDTTDKLLENKQNYKETAYCYTEKQNEKLLKNCAQQKKYTIIPNIIIKNKPLTEIKKNIASGSIISMPINKTTEQELQLIINYMKTKGYNIQNLQEHLSEKNKIKSKNNIDF